MKTGHFRTFLRCCLLAAAAVSAVSCIGDAFKDITAGQWYHARYDGTEYFVIADNIDPEKGTISGSFYAAGTDCTASRHQFSAISRRRKIQIEADGQSIKSSKGAFELAPYTAPEYNVADTSLYRIPESFDVKCTEDVVYGHAHGYWTHLPGVEAEVSKAFTDGYIKSFRRRHLALDLDLYQPQGVSGPRPLILFIHGGAFYVGDKQEPAYVDFCEHFASMGYVTASMNYRLGFHAGKGEVERAGYVALQDAHAAMRFLVSKAKEYNIDTGRIFVAGSSAGSITALNLAFMTEKDRPESSYGGKGLFNGNDLGRIDGSGNSIKADFRILAIANMWGAVSSTDIISNSKTDIISFHGDADNVVPYAEGYPFSSAGPVISQMLSEQMYGSACIDEAAEAAGLRHRMFTFEGEGHALNTTGKQKTPNANHTFIKKETAKFFFREIMPVQPKILRKGPGEYTVSTSVESAQWKVEGGFVLSQEGNDIKVLWQADAPEHRITASGCCKGNVGFNYTREEIL